MKKELTNAKELKSQFYKNRINMLKKSRYLHIGGIIVFIIISISCAYFYTYSMEEIINDRVVDSIEIVKEYYSNGQPYSEKILEYSLDAFNSTMNRSKSLLDGFAGFGSLLFSVVSIAFINRTFQISTKIEEYEEKYIITLAEEIPATSKNK